MGVPVSYSESEDEFNQTIEQLIGGESNELINELGLPTSRIRFYDSILYIYARLADANVLDIMLPVTTYKQGVLLCYYIKIDTNGRLLDFTRTWYNYSGYHSERHLCQLPISSRNYLYDPFNKHGYKPYEPGQIPVPLDYYECDYSIEKKRDKAPVYWSQIKSPWLAKEEELISAAVSGNPEARLQLYWNDTSNGMYWLCRAANQGFPKARYRIAQLYEFGDDGVPMNIAQAYMWYNLAAQACHPWSRKDATRIATHMLTKDELQKTKDMIEQWSPIDCDNWPKI